MAYARELVAEAQKQLTDIKAIAGFPDPTTGVVEWKKPDTDGNIKDEKGNIVFTTSPEGKLVPVPREIPSREHALELEKTSGYPEAYFNDMAKAKNTAYYYIVFKPAPLSQEQINTLRESGVRMLKPVNPEDAAMLKNNDVGISDEKSVYAALIEEDSIKIVDTLDFVVSVNPRPQESNSGITLIEESDKYSYTVTSKDDYIWFLKEAEQAKDLAYLGDKLLPDGKRVKVLHYTLDYSKICSRADCSYDPHTIILGIDESNLPVVRINYNPKDGGGVMFQRGEIRNGQPLPSGQEGIQYGKLDPNAPQPKSIEEIMNFWTENLEQRPDFEATEIKE